MQIEEVLSGATELGIRIDRKVLGRHLTKVNESLSTLVQDADAEGLPSRYSSNKDIAEWFYDELMVTPVVTTKAGGRSVAKGVLEQHFDRHPHVKRIHKAKTLIKLAGYLKSTIDRSGMFGRIHPEFLLDNCSSGRIYMKGPSVQTVPAHVREGIIPEDGKVFLYYDYKQQELRILAWASGDTALQAQLDSEDPHAEMAKTALGKDSVTKEERARVGKVLNYAIPYGMEAKGVGAKVGVSEDAGVRIYENVMAARPQMAEWMEEMKAAAEETGFLSTLISGKQYKIDKTARDQPKEIRRAVNHIIQGTAADILRAKIEAIGDIKGVQLTVVNQDSFLVQVDRDRIWDLDALIRSELTSGLPFAAPVDGGIGENWAEAQSMEFHDLEVDAL